MAGEPAFRKDLFVGTATYYDRFRPPYAPVLIDDVRARVPVGAGTRLLDLACGTGQVTFALAAQVAEVWAVDQEAEAVEFGARTATARGLTNIHWIAAAAETVTVPDRLDLVTIGNAFHRLDRDAVAGRLAPHLDDGGCVALLWSGSPWSGDRPWQRTLDAALIRWTTAAGAADRIPAGWQAAIDRDSHESVLRRAGLRYEGRSEWSVPHRWTIDELIGFAYSTSFLARPVLGDRAAAFEQDLRAELLPYADDGVFEQELTYAYELARRPG
jgi:SAM-dependent methyltransferase